MLNFHPGLLNFQSPLTGQTTSTVPLEPTILGIQETETRVGLEMS